ncbi:MAG: glycosyltransferase [Candidatus Cloacimonetes bacterium]|nr:glycosyltransferase [Candidatus Cloacimonadota bacterium]
MKITIISTFPPYRGGIAHFNTLLYNYFKKNHDVSVINFSRQYPNILFPGKSQLDNKTNIEEAFNNRLLDSINPLSWIKVFQKLKKDSPNLIIYKYWMPFFAPSIGTIAFLANRHTKIKSLCIIDNLLPHERRLGDMLLSKYIINNTNYFLVMSKKVEEELIKLKPDAKYKLVKHPIYNNFGKPLSKQVARKNLDITEEKVILYFGYIRKYKGIEYLIKAVPKILENVDVKTIIAGEFYESREPYIQEIKKTGKEDKIMLVDSFIPDDRVNAYFSAADLVVLPYTSATQSGIVQIAMNYNLPCLVTKVGGLPEVIKHGKNGFLVPPENSDAIAQAVIDFYKVVNRPRMVENVRDQKLKYGWNQIENSMLELYSSQR